MNGSRALRVVLGVVLAAVGCLCLNYTKGFDVERHVRWAAAHGFPAPSYPIFLAGVGLVALGSLLVGTTLAARPNPL